MKEIFKNETKCSKKEYKMFLDVHDREYGFLEDLYTIIYASFFICFIILSFISHIFLTGFIILMILIIFLAYRIIQPNLVIRKELNSKKIRQEYKNIYYFYEHSFIVKNKEKKSKIYYIKIHRILENDTHFYIYLTKTKAFVVSKSGFIKGTSEEFSKFIKKKTFFKYKDRNKNKKKK